MNEDGFQHIYAVELFYQGEPDFNLSDLSNELGKAGLNVSAVSSKDQEMFAFVLDDLSLEIEGKSLHPQIAVGKYEPKTRISDYQSAFDQSRRMPTAEEIVENCDHVVLISDMFAHALPYLERLDILRKSISAVLNLTECKAIHWTHTQQFTSPTDFLDAQEKKGLDWAYTGFINFRAYNIGNKTGEMIVDTVGLSAIGLTDLQCHFHKIDPNQIFSLFLNLSYYLLENGNVIKDGHTVPGLSEEDKWKCRLEKSLVEPDRAVLDINPGPQFSAGKRKN
jgi:hypothetical protein